MNAVPFRVTVTLKTPAMLRPDMTLDAILAAAIYRQTNDIERAHRDVPLKCSPEGVWHASCVTLREGEWCDQGYVARLSGRDLEPVRYSDAPRDRHGRIRVFLGGRTYAAQVRRLKQFIGRVQFDGCGDVERTRALIGSLPGIGKNTSQGGGRIADIEIDRSDADQSVVVEGMPSRPVPVRVWTGWGLSDSGCATDCVGWQPAYWDSSKHEVCVVPG